MKTPSLLALSAALAVLPGCFIESSEPNTVVVSGDGLLTVTWTVAGTSDPSECAFQGADAIDIVVQTTGGSVIAEVTDDCEEGVTSISLPPGTYYADAVLLDRAGRTITTPADLGRFTLYGDDELILDADFPGGSFY
jgi:hypothetical protein